MTALLRVKLITTAGPWQAATIQHGERRLCVVDEFTIVASSAPKPNEEFEVELSATVEEGTSWETMFAGNPGHTKGLEPTHGWAYRAFGQIISLHPVVVDCGLLAIPDVLHTNDARVIGEFIAFPISRLCATLHVAHGA